MNDRRGQSSGSNSGYKEDPQDYDYSINDPKLVEDGSGDGVNADEYPEDEEDEESKLPDANGSTFRNPTISSIIPIVTTRYTMITRTTMSSTTTTTTATTTTTTTSTAITSTTTTTPTTTTARIMTPYALLPVQPKKPNLYHESRLLKKTQSTTTTTTTASGFNGNDASEFDDNEDYEDEIEEENHRSDILVSTKVLPSSYATPRLTTTTRFIPSAGGHYQNYSDKSSMFAYVKFFKSSHIAIGILVCLTVGILTSIVLLICIIQRYHKREKSHSSYTTGLLYPHQYGYSKAPQEFYA